MYKHIFVTMGILHTPYMVIMSMVSMVIMRLMYEVDEAKVSSVSERIGERFFADVHLHSTCSLKKCFSADVQLCI